jgi:hypothetical protein
LGIPGILTASMHSIVLLVIKYIFITIIEIGAGVACLTDADDSEDYMKTMTLNLQENLERHEN